MIINIIKFADQIMFMLQEKSSTTIIPNLPEYTTNSAVTVLYCIDLNLQTEKKLGRLIDNI